MRVRSATVPVAAGGDGKECWDLLTFFALVAAPGWHTAARQQEILAEEFGAWE